jgi:hypothetical protein
MSECLVGGNFGSRSSSNLSVGIYAKSNAADRVECVPRLNEGISGIVFGAPNL